MSILQEKIIDIQSSLKNYSENLAKRNQLVDIPWTMVDGDLNLQRLIFRKDNSLYIVKEGEINESRWEYLSELDSLIIVISGKKILMNEIYSDRKALILKKDGSNTDFLAFANHKELPDLNLINYFDKLSNPKEITLEKTVNEDQFNVDQDGLRLLGAFIVIIMITFIILGISN